jgi:hypothetical protein
MEGDIVVMQLEATRAILPHTQLTIRYTSYTQVIFSYIRKLWRDIHID